MFNDNEQVHLLGTMNGNGSPSRQIRDRNNAPTTNGTPGPAPAPAPKQPDRGRVIFLNGFPGVGKLTISKILTSKLPPTSTLLIDNHLLIDPVHAIIPSRGNAHKDLRRRFRQVAFDALKEDPNPDLMIVMMGCVGDNVDDGAVYAEHVEVARARGVPFVSVNLVCGREDHQRRFGDPKRYEGARSKLADKRVLEELMENHELLDPRTGRAEGWLRGTEGDIRHFEVDTTGLSAEDSALRILDLAGA